MDFELIKYLTPPITFALGIFVQPFSEKWRNRFKKRKNKEDLIEELRDESKWLGGRIKKMAGAFVCLDEMVNGKYPSTNSLIRYMPRKTSVRFMKTVLDENYADLKMEERNALKSIEVLIEEINRLANQIQDARLRVCGFGFGFAYDQQDLSDLMAIKKRFIYSACILRHSMQFVAKDKNEDAIELGDNKTIELQLTELDFSRIYDKVTD